MPKTQKKKKQFFLLFSGFFAPPGGPLFFLFYPYSYAVGSTSGAVYPSSVSSLEIQESQAQGSQARGARTLLQKAPTTPAQVSRLLHNLGN